METAAMLDTLYKQSKILFYNSLSACVLVCVRLSVYLSLSLLYPSL